MPHSLHLQSCESVCLCGGRGPVWLSKMMSLTRVVSHMLKSVGRLERSVAMVPW